jgi:ferrous iron transport protein A
MNLSDVTIRESVRIVEIVDGSLERDRLADLGFLPGTIIQRVGQAPAGDPLVFLIRGLRLAMRRSDAKCIVVEPA